MKYFFVSVFFNMEAFVRLRTVIIETPEAVLTHSTIQNALSNQYGVGGHFKIVSISKISKEQYNEIAREYIAWQGI